MVGELYFSLIVVYFVSSALPARNPLLSCFNFGRGIRNNDEPGHSAAPVTSQSAARAPEHHQMQREQHPLQPAHQPLQPAHQPLQPAHQPLQPAHQPLQPAHQPLPLQPEQFRPAAAQVRLSALLAHSGRAAEFHSKRNNLLHSIRLQEFLEPIELVVDREDIFEDSFRSLRYLPAHMWKQIFSIHFQGEEGKGVGLLPEWYDLITRDMLNADRLLFMTIPFDRASFTISPSCPFDHDTATEYFEFVGKIVAKAIYDGQQLPAYFARSIYKHILALPVDCNDLKEEDPSVYKSLQDVVNKPAARNGLTFEYPIPSAEGVKYVELKPGGSEIDVTDANKYEFERLACKAILHDAIKTQLGAFLNGFYTIIPQSSEYLRQFNVDELQLLISGVSLINAIDLQNNAVYYNYTTSSEQINWFWDVVRSFNQNHLANLLHFVTGTSRAPLEGFAHMNDWWGRPKKFGIVLGTLYNMNDASLPGAITCENILILPEYKTKNQLRKKLTQAITDGTKGFAIEHPDVLRST